MEKNNEKQLHDKRVELSRETGSYPDAPDVETAYNCLNRMRKRAGKALGDDHLKTSFEHALDSAEGAEIFTVVEEGDTEEHRAIVRNLKDNWQQDTKYINAPNDAGFIVGNTITWKRLDSMKWLLVWQDFNYSSFFKGEMHRASHLLSWRDENGVVQRQWAVIRGPVETKAKYDNVGGEYMGGRQNDTLEILIGARDVHAVKSLSRFDKIKVGTRTWRIVVRDDISNRHILRMSCLENFNNDYTDDVINAIPDGLVEFPEVVVPPSVEENIIIVGKNAIKEGFNGTYTAKIDEEVILGDFKVMRDSELISEATGVSSITFKGTKYGDILTIEFYKDGELKTSANVEVVSMFG